MKKITWGLVAVMVLSLLLVVVGCKTQTAATTTAAESTTTAAETTAGETTKAGKIKITFLITDTNHVYWTSQVDAMTKRAEELGVEFKVLNAKYDVNTQTSQVDTVILEKPDAVIYTAVDSGAAIAHLDKMKAAGIKVVNNNRHIAGGNYDVSIVLDELFHSTESAKRVIDFLTEKYGSPKGLVLEMHGALSDENAILRHQGFHSIIDAYDDIKVIVRNTEWNFDTAAKVALDAFQAHNDIDAVFLHSDFITPAMAPILDKYPKVGEKGHIYVVSSAGDPSTFPLIRNGEMDVTYNFDTLQLGILSIDLAMKLVNGEKIEAGEIFGENEKWGPVTSTAAPRGGVDILMKPYPVDKTNVDDPNLWGNIYATK